MAQRCSVEKVLTYFSLSKVQALRTSCTVDYMLGIETTGHS